MSLQHSPPARQGPGLHGDLSSPKQRPSWCSELFKLVLRSPDPYTGALKNFNFLILVLRYSWQDRDWNPLNFKLVCHYLIYLNRNVWIAWFVIQCSTHFAIVKIHTRSNFTIHDNTWPKQRPTWCGELSKLFGNYLNYLSSNVWIALLSIPYSTNFVIVKIPTRSNFTIHDNTFSRIEYTWYSIIGQSSLFMTTLCDTFMTPLWHD